MGKHSAQGISYWEARRRRKDLRNRAKGKPARRRGPYSWAWFVAFFMVGILAGGALGYYAKPLAKLGAEVYLSFKERQWQPKGAEKKEVAKSLTQLSTDPDASVNTLIMGSDAGSNKGEDGWCRSDVMMLVCLQERDKRAVVLSIPRDTKVELPGHGTNKVNAAHSYGGPSGAIDAVKSLTGIDVHHFISMNFEGFKKIINAIGGVPIHLTTPINDPHAGYLPAGDLMLDGEQALIIVRSRRLPAGDLDRIRSQQAFIKALMHKAETMKDVWKAKQLVDIIASTCQMDYTAGQLTSLAEELRGFSVENVQFVTVPGDAKNIGGVSYYVANMPMLAQVATEIKQNTSLSPELTAKLASPESRRVEELYGPNADVVTVLSGTKGVAWMVPTVAQELRMMGHEKVFEGSAKQVHQKTTVIYRKEAKENCEKILGSVPELAGADVVQNDEVAGQYNSPVVVVLGSNFATPNLVSIYGRVMKPAVDFVNMGKRVKSFS
jgi:polyisoprenyl-teichoic acid--peptidoglycan teichoic acid transferase